MRNSLPINQRFTKVDLEIKIETDRTSCPETDLLVEVEVKVEIGEIKIIETTIDQNYRNRSRGRWDNHRSGDRSNNYQTNNR